MAQFTPFIYIPDGWHDGIYNNCNFRSLREKSKNPIPWCYNVGCLIQVFPRSLCLRLLSPYVKHDLPVNIRDALHPTAVGRANG